MSTSSPSSSISTRHSSWRSSWPTSPCVSSWTTKALNRTAHCPSSRRSRLRRCRLLRGEKGAAAEREHLSPSIINALFTCLWHEVDWTLMCYGWQSSWLSKFLQGRGWKSNIVLQIAQHRGLCEILKMASRSQFCFVNTFYVSMTWFHCSALFYESISCCKMVVVT